jgi:hypothetical protein
MDCKTILENDLHERYVLGLLDESEKLKYEQHLDGCDSCQKQLEHERTLISGIRGVGRQEMKAEIRRQVEIEKSGKATVSWGMISKVAAVLLFVVITPAVIYYSQIDTPDEIPILPKSEEQIAPEQQADEASAEKLPDRLTREPHDLKTAEAPEQAPIQGDVGAKSEGVAKIKPSGKRGETGEGDPASVDVKTEMPEKSGARGKAVLSAEKDASAMESVPGQSETEKEMLVDEERIKSLLSLKKRESPAISPDASEDRIAAFRAAQTQQDQPAQARGQLTKVKTARVRTYGYEKGTMPPLGSKLQEQEADVAEAESRVIALSDLEFRSNGRTLVVHLWLSAQYPPRGDESKPLESFEVGLSARDSLRWEMNWYVDSGFLDYDPAKMWMQSQEVEIMLVHIEDGINYRIDLRNDSTRAILLNKP